MSTFEERMAEYDDEWTEDELQSRGAAVLPDGPHQVVVREARVEEINERDVLKIRFGNEQGVVTKWQNLENDVGRKIAMQDARALGYTGKLSQIANALDSGEWSPVNLLCEIRIKTEPGENRDWTRVYLNRVIGAVQRDGTAAEFVGGQDDDIPF